MITGLPASGKSRAALRLFLESPNSTLLTPTSTMAEHVRNELARANAAIRPNRILTLAKFLEPFTELQPAPDSLLHLLIRMQAPNQFPGYHRALAALVQEVPADALPGQLVRIARDIEDQLAMRGMALRETRLRTAEPVVDGPLVLDGFFTFSPSELALLARLASGIDVTVTLPDWPGSADARARLLKAGFVERRQEQTLRASRRTVSAALSLDQEVEQIARRILEHDVEGREFREIGVILRSRTPYAPALESAFARFGIPARFHFTATLDTHPAIQYLSGLIRQSDPLPLLRMPVSGIGATPEGDQLDFKMREELPDSSYVPHSLLDGAWRLVSTPAEWAAHLKPLRALIPQPEIADQVDFTQLQIWRSTAAALEAFGNALDITAQALPERRMTLDQFWPHVEAVLAIEKLRVQDRRRNVVNVMDVYEARQWEIPIAFVPGLNERHFPHYHHENPLLPDAARTKAAQEEERFLFELATTRATKETILSYARYNDKGDAQLRSFFLEEEGQPLSSPRMLPRVEQALDLPNGEMPDLRKKHAKLSPTSIESFQQCPFQFFARKTLRLRKRPEKPRDRLNALVQGSILHRALAEGELDRVFEEECERHHIPRTYRKEAVRLEILRHFEAWQADRQWPLFWPSVFEQDFAFAVTPELSIRGRIDRIDTGPKGEAVVIDYKYSAAATVKERVKGDPIQGGLYLLAAQRAFALKPVGMFYCGLRESVTWEGWHTGIPGLSLGEWITAAGLKELIEAAKQTAIETFETIAGGNADVRPADESKCRYCDYNEICRIESQARARTAHESFE